MPFRCFAWFTAAFSILLPIWEPDRQVYPTPFHNCSEFPCGGNYLFVFRKVVSTRKEHPGESSPQGNIFSTENPTGARIPKASSVSGSKALSPILYSLFWKRQLFANRRFRTIIQNVLRIVLAQICLGMERLACFPIVGCEDLFDRQIIMRLLAIICIIFDLDRFSSYFAPRSFLSSTPGSGIQ